MLPIIWCGEPKYGACKVNFPVAVTEYPAKEALRRNGPFRLVCAGKELCQEQVAAGPSASTVERETEEREGCWCSTGFTLVFSSNLSPWAGVTNIRMGLS